MPNQSLPSVTARQACRCGLLLILISLASLACAEPVNIPDATLRATLEDALGKSPGATISSEEMETLITFEPFSSTIVDLTGLEYATNLETLTIEWDDVVDLSPLSELTNLRVLNLAGNEIINLSPLQNLVNLESLSIWRNRIIDVSPLSGLTNLHTLQLHTNYINDISALSELSNLRTLTLLDNNVSNISILSGMPLLEEAYLGDNLISDISPLAGLVNLTLLQLEDNAFHDITPLSNLTGLKELNLSSNSIDDISTVSLFSNLEKLDLSNTSTSDITPLSGLTQLTNLLLYNNDITDISHLSGLTNLMSLYLYGNELEDISALSTLVNLEFLELHSNSISDISPLEPLKALTNLSVRDNWIMDISVLKTLPALERLSLQENYIYIEPGFDARVNVIDPLLQAGATVFYTPQRTLPPADPTIEISPTDIDLVGSRETTTSFSITITNSGQGNLYWAASTSDNWYTLEERAGTLTEGASTELNIEFCIFPSAQTELSGMITLRSTDDETGTLEIPVEYHAYVNIPNSVLRTKLEIALGLAPGTPISREQMESLTTFEPDSILISDLTGLEYAKNLEKLSLDWSGSADLSPLSGLIKLKDLNLERNQISDLSPLQNLINLESLNIRYNQIDDISILGNFNKLKVLQLLSNSVSDISPLSSCHLLEELKLEYNPISDISPIGNLANLRVLYLYDNDFSDISPLANLTNLEDLNLSENNISNITALGNLLKLKTLSLASCTIEDISPLSGLTQLTTLLLSTNRITDISAVSGLTELDVLYLHENEITDISPLGGLTNLHILALGDNPISDLSPVGNLVNLTRLAFENSQASDISFLANLHNLTRLVLYANEVSDISVLDSLQKLEDLHLDHNQIRDISVLNDLPLLSTVFINDNYIDISEDSDARVNVIDPLTARGVNVHYSPQLIPPPLPYPVIELSDQDFRLTGSMESILSLNLTITNTEGEVLEWSASTSDDWITLNPQAGSNTARESATLTIQISTMNPDSEPLAGSIIITSNDADNPSLEVTINVAPPVVVPDANLRTALEDALALVPGTPISQERMESLTSLTASDSEIADLTSLERVINLQELVLANNQINDLSLLAQLKELEVLDLRNNQIQDLSPLSRLTKLRVLILSGNRITDISCLSSLIHLSELNLQDNYIDIAEGSGAMADVIEPFIESGVVVDYSPQKESQMEISTTGFRFIALPGDPLSADLEITNAGTNDLVWSTSSQDMWITMESASGILTSGEKQTLQLEIAAVPEFTSLLTGNISLRSNDSESPVLDIPIEILAPVEIPDAGLRAVLEEALGLEAGDPLTAPDMANLQTLDASQRNIADLTGLENAINLQELSLRNNRLSDISSLVSLELLVSLDLRDNFIHVFDGSASRVQVIDPMILRGVEVQYRPQVEADIRVSPDSFILVSSPGEPDQAVLTIRNEGQNALNWTAAGSDSWIHFETSSGVLASGNSISIQANLDAPSSGSGPQVGSISISSNDPDTPVWNVPIKLYPEIHFPDSNLETALRQILNLAPGAPVSAWHLEQLTSLNLNTMEIHNLSGLELATNLESLDLSWNSIRNLNPIQDLQHLSSLDLRMNFLDIRPGCRDRLIIDALDEVATVTYDPQRYIMQSFEDFLTLHDISPDSDGPMDMNGPLGIPNRLSFSMGINPMTATREQMPALQRNADTHTVSFCFFSNEKALDVDSIIEMSPDLDSWTAATPDEVIILSDDGDGLLYLEAVFADPGDPAYFRLTVAPAPSNE